MLLLPGCVRRKAGGWVVKQLHRGRSLLGVWSKVVTVTMWRLDAVAGTNEDV